MGVFLIWKVRLLAAVKILGIMLLGAVLALGTFLGHGIYRHLLEDDQQLHQVIQLLNANITSGHLEVPTQKP